MIYCKHSVETAPPAGALTGTCESALGDIKLPANKLSLCRRKRIRFSFFQKEYAQLIISGLFFSLFTFTALLLPSNFLVQGAGPAIDVNSNVDGMPLVEINGVTTYPGDTHYFMTTVSAWGSPERGVAGAQALAALFNPEKQIVPVRAYYPKEVTDADVQAQNAQLMHSSQDSAALLAFEMAGYEVSMDVTVVGTDPLLPSGKVLQAGDIIREIRTVEGSDPSVEPTSIRSHYQLSKVLDRLSPGTKIALKVEREGEIREVVFETIAYEPDTLGWVHPGSLLGVAITVENVQLPGTVKYLVAGIGGPSAGNIFALHIYDQLNSGSLGAEANIAGTGTVAWDGDVGPIGGIVHKLSGAAAAGATDFLAPAENCAETIGYEPDGMRIWAVRTTEESVEAVKAIAAGNTGNLISCKELVSQAATAEAERK